MEDRLQMDSHSQPPLDPLPHQQPLAPDPELDGMLEKTSNAWLTGDPTFDWNALDDYAFCSSNTAEWMVDPELTRPPSLQPGQDLGPLQDQPSSALSPQRINSPSPQRSLTNVSEWLDGAYRPPMPCSHCHRHRLQCLIIRTTPANPNPIAACSSCVALFRECSLAKGEKRRPSRFETLSPVVGHLHGVPEGADDGVIMTESSVDNLETMDKRKESKQFVRKGARILSQWLCQNQENPYPTEAQKAQLSRETGFSSKRISTWFANARRRQRQKLQSSTVPSAALFRAGSPMVTSTLAPMTPMERWQASPPEDEPVPESAIQDAIASAATQSELSTDMFQMDESALNLFNFDDPSSHLPSSVSSLGSKASETSDSVSSAWSYQSSGEGGLPFPFLAHRNPRRRKRGRQRRAEEENLYQCTFCTQSFKKRHDWARHEKSVHLPLDSWICTPDLSHLEQQFLESQASDCRFCQTSLPTRAHWEEHEFHICAAKPVAERSFSRKDYLWQHLRKFHACTKLPVPDLDSWRDPGATVRSRCGFCACSLPSWSARMRHLVEHFKNGARMDRWEGDWGLDSSALTVLRDAVLPYQRLLASPPA